MADTPQSLLDQASCFVCLGMSEYEAMELVLLQQIAAGGGAKSFLDLTDAPHSYVGQGGTVVSVKLDETGLEFTAGGGGGVPTTRQINTTAPLAGGGDLSANRTLTIANAKADGATLGAAAFLAADFNDNGSGVISIDYVNGQKATAAQPGFLSATDWTTFNNKQAALGFTPPPNTRLISTTAPLSGGGDLTADRTLTVADFVASGVGHARGTVPDPGAVGGTTKFLCEDATFKVPPGTGLTAVTADSPLSGSGTSGSHLVIADAVADGATKGAATFTASDFNSAAGVISIDYTNGQAADSTHKGFLTSTDWNTFNNKWTPLADPNANKFLAWDDTDNTYVFVAYGTNLTYDHATHTLNATGGGGSQTPWASDIDSNQNKLTGNSGANYLWMDDNLNGDQVVLNSASDLQLIGVTLDLTTTNGNLALTANSGDMLINFDGALKVNGTPSAADGTYPNPTSITIVGGIITAIS